ncbi:MAG: hypothetical protein NVV66_18665 [Cellulomonas sp.]|uniref:hypothetical protein n=1 Tax=Cellulomonas sp. TaxID=40001 RepID=UPI0025872350|nr:hypothetical protein [Cellulomonas sp.]MCR6706619.1 hypothetical protein [Cellulomonas sp.]
MNIDPRLIREGQSVYHSLLDEVASGQGLTVAAAPKPGNKTALATVVVDLACRVDNAVGAHQSAAHAVLRARNVAAHMAQSDATQTLQVVSDMELFTAAALDALRSDKTAFFGAMGLALASDAAVRLQEQVQADAARKVNAARAAYEQLRAGLDVEKIRQLDSVLTSRSAPPDEGWATECPACDYDGAWLSVETEYEYDREGMVYGGIRVLGLTCTRCGLDLDNREVDAAGVDTTYYGEDDADWRDYVDGSDL